MPRFPGSHRLSLAAQEGISQGPLPPSAPRRPLAGTPTAECRPSSSTWCGQAWSPDGAWQNSPSVDGGAAGDRPSLNAPFDAEVDIGTTMMNLHAGVIKAVIQISPRFISSSYRSLTVARFQPPPDRHRGRGACRPFPPRRPRSARISPPATVAAATSRLRRAPVRSPAPAPVRPPPGDRRRSASPVADEILHLLALCLCLSFTCARSAPYIAPPPGCGRSAPCRFGSGGRPLAIQASRYRARRA